ncbi:thioredoxin fold domain-containing protein [Gramella sp. MAR_2010_147]|uniref:thioredoxin family protein n=1 Tax=Gramella sp. MAR_2010_147 TaxID=1250205 RepID=UPI00087A3D2D|nr:thioredoxin fold domain-containing protein [Gramella sp. MAR_2010_147]SDS41684.1 Thioredoxin-like domain-containing protein [Gramella sp. MAR_2010_147]
MMKKLIIILLILGFQSINAQNEIKWIGFEELEDSLKSEIKPVVIYFYTDWCVYCKKMDRNAFKDQEIISSINEKYYAVKMNAESTKTINFEGQTFTNEQSKTKRNGIHQIPLMLASRKDKPVSFPVVMVLDTDFRVRKKSHEYLTSEKMKLLIKG